MSANTINIDKRPKKFKPHSLLQTKALVLWGGLFALVGVITLLSIRAATPITVDGSLPNPTNVRAWGDDRVITVSWDAPSNASSRGIVGYYITWGKQNGGVYTNAKQSTHTITQIQPVDNNAVYNIKVQSVHGSYVQVTTPEVHTDSSPTVPEARGSGRVSTGATTTATPTSARVDQLRSQMTGFFDDFNTAAGAFDELKWNHATSGCADIGSAGAFINNQFHSHNQIRSSCDRAQIVSRARGVFDITGKTESNPGVIAFDFDGVTHGRDVWYIDLIPVDARKNQAPLDITSHNSAFDDAPGDPKMLRLVQFHDKLHFIQYDNNKVPRYITPTFTCPGWDSDFTIIEWCNIGEEPVNGLSPIAEPAMAGDPNTQFPVENVRQHWIIQISGTKIKLFINSMLIWEGPMPSDFVNNKKFVVHSNLFSYNTGKGDSENPTTSLLHWDNFGFNGPASNIVTHNYLEGGPTGTTSYLGYGTTTNRLPNSPRTTKVNIPDQIGSPAQARVMFTIGSNQWYYTWNANDHILVNGKRYNFPNPSTNIQPPITNDWYGPSFGDGITPYADSIVINAADLKQGINDIVLNLEPGHSGGLKLYNVHVELDYTKGSQPSYTQPKDIFGATAFMAAHQPAMSSHDSYLFVEQDMGLPSGVIAGNPTPGDTQAPTVSITSPTNGAIVTRGTQLGINITANDNVGVNKVELFVDGTRNTTITHSPFSHVLDTSSLTSGNHTIVARAFDEADNSTQSNSVVISITQPADTTKPTITLNSPSNNTSVVIGNTLSASATANDNVGLSKVEFWVDNALAAIGAADGSTYSALIQTGSLGTGQHNLFARAYDIAGNTQNSTSITFNLNSSTCPVGQTGTPPNCTTPTPKKGDINGDNSVNFTDLVILLGNYGKNVSANTSGDLNGDGRVNFPDLLILLGNYGS